MLATRKLSSTTGLMEVLNDELIEAFNCMDSLITAAKTNDNAYLNRFQDEIAAEIIMNYIDGEFRLITGNLQTIHEIIEREKLGYAASSRANMLSDSWKSLSTELLRHRCCLDKSITYRCDQLAERTDNAEIKALLELMKDRFQTCKTMLQCQLFGRLANRETMELQEKMKEEHTMSEDRSLRQTGHYSKKIDNAMKSLRAMNADETRPSPRAARR